MVFTTCLETWCYNKIQVQFFSVDQVVVWRNSQMIPPQFPFNITYLTYNPISKLVILIGNPDPDNISQQLITFIVRGVKCYRVTRMFFPLHKNMTLIKSQATDQGFIYTLYSTGDKGILNITQMVFGEQFFINNSVYNISLIRKMNEIEIPIKDIVTMDLTGNYLLIYAGT